MKPATAIALLLLIPVVALGLYVLVTRAGSDLCRSASPAQAMICGGPRS